MYRDKYTLYRSLSLDTYIYMYREKETCTGYIYLDTYIYIFFQAKRDNVAFYDLPGTLNNVRPVRPSCFDQVFLDNCGRRTYNVRGERVVGRMVQ